MTIMIMIYASRVCVCVYFWNFHSPLALFANQKNLWLIMQRININMTLGHNYVANKLKTKKKQNYKTGNSKIEAKAYTPKV